MNDGHRACIGTEHDPVNGKLHGYCVRCGTPWPCEAEQQWIDLRTTLVQAAATELITAQEKRRSAQEKS